MAATLVAGAPPTGVRAQRQWLDPQSQQWKGVRDRNGSKVPVPKGARTRWRAQASVRLWTGEVVKRDAKGPTAAVAERRVIDVLQALLDESSPSRPRTDLRVAEVARLWLAAPERHDVAASTLAVYEATATRWLLTDPLPPVAKLRVRELEPRDVSAWLLDVAASSGIPTARTARSVLSAVLRHAIAEGHATVNPVRDATTPSPRVVAAVRTKRGTPTPPRRPGPGARLDHSRAFTASEVQRVLAAAIATPERCDDDLVDLLAFLDGTGVRLGAALATLWTDLDLDGTGWSAGTQLDPRYAWLMTGTHTITRAKGVGVVRSEYGATKRHPRYLALPTDLADRLRKRHAAFPGTAYVFPNPLHWDMPREVSFVTKRLRRIFDATTGDDGLPMTWAMSHAFRRSLVTDAHDAGIPERHIAGQTGHERIQVLQDHYIARVHSSTLAADLRDAAPRSAADGRSNSASNPAQLSG